MEFILINIYLYHPKVTIFFTKKNTHLYSNEEILLHFHNKGFILEVFYIIAMRTNDEYLFLPSFILFLKFNLKFHQPKLTTKSKALNISGQLLKFVQ